MLTRAWRRLVALGFRLLYNQLAWTYHAVSHITSLGLWRRWQRTVWPHLPPGGRVLEIACGPGHVLVDLANAGYHVTGVDPSPGMHRLAGRKAASCQTPFTLCRAQVPTLPFASGSFDALVLTFPTPFVYATETHLELHRVLGPRGRLIIVERAELTGHSPQARILEWLYRITGQRRPDPDLANLLAKQGFAAKQQTVQVRKSVVTLTVADK